MKTSDKWLLVIVGGIVLLVIAAFLITLSRPEAEFLTDDSPGNAAHNYLLALQNEDYARAYEYLSPALEGYPESAAKFERDVRENEWAFRKDLDVRLNVAMDSVVESGDRAYVEVREARFNADSIFSTSQTTRTFEMTLLFENNAWKILDSEGYFASCWRRSGGC